MSNSCEIRNKPKDRKTLLRSWYFWKPVLGFSLGAVAGLMYYYFYGAASGGSPITSDLYSNAFFGGIIGLFIVKRPCSTC